MALVWKFRIFAGTNVGIILLVNLLLPLSLASWTFFIAAPFGKSPQLSAITSVLVSFIFAILALVLKGVGNGGAFLFTILFPSGFYVFVIRAICGFENNQVPTSIVKPDPDNNLRVIVPVIAAIVRPSHSNFILGLTSDILRLTSSYGHISPSYSNAKSMTPLI
jgi:ATP-binding cassette subfamily A (ABC1) protein 3